MKARLRGPAIMAVAVASMVGGFLAITATSASAVTNHWYVATTGNDTGNSCASATNPCATLNRALLEQGLSNTPGDVISVAAGTYVGQVNIGPANDGVKIKGTGATTIIEPPPAGLLSDTDTDSAEPQYYVVDVAPGTTGVTLNKLSVSGLNASSFLNGDGYGCGQDYVGIYFHEASGTISKVSVNGIDMPSNLFGCQGGQGIYVNSDEADPASVTMNKVSELSPETTITTKADLPAGTYSNDQLAVHTLPAGFTSGPIIVNGFNLTATRDTNKVLFITGTTGADSPSGSVVNFEPYTPAYDKNGITCDDAYTNCTITDATVQGEGPNNGIAQNGIQGFAANVIDVTGSTVSNDSWSGGGGAGNAASGILILNSGTVNVTGNTVSNSDVNIYAGNVPAYGLNANTIGDWNIDNNNVSGATSEGESAGEPGYGEGIQLDSTSNTVDVYGNTVTTSAQANVLLTGASGAFIGNVGEGDANMLTSPGDANLIVGGPGSQCEYQYGNSCAYPDTGYSSSNDQIIDNTMTGERAGALIEGAYAPDAYGGSNPEAAINDSFAGNQWTNGVNVLDFSGETMYVPVQNQYGPSDPNSVPSNTPDNSCDPTAGGSSLFNALTMTSGVFWAC